MNALEARHLDEVTNDAEARRLGMEWIKTHTMGFVKLLPKKFAHMWGPDGESEWAYEGGFASFAKYEGLFRAVRMVNQGWYFLILAGGVAAAATMVRKRRAAGQNEVDWWLLPYGIVGYVTVIIEMFSGQTRYHFPAMPLLCLACGWLLVHWLKLPEPQQER